MRYVVLFFLCLMSLSSQALDFKLPFKNNLEFLPVTEAFPFSFTPSEDNTVELTWEIAEGYYLYQHQLNVTETSDTNANIRFASLPTAIEKYDEYFGDVLVYRQQLKTKLIYDAVPAGTEISFNLTFQGCADRGLCYPPQTLPLQVVTTAAPISNAHTAESKVSNKTTQQDLPAPSQAGYVISLLETGNIFFVIITLFGLGLLLSLTPCVLPMVPIVSAIVVGNKTQQNNQETDTSHTSSVSWQGFYYSFIYVLGMALTYAAMGALAGYFGTQFNLQAQLQSPIVLMFSITIFVLLALAMFGVYQLQLPAVIQTKLTHIGQAKSQSKSISVFVMGVLATLVVSPCVSAPLAGVIFFISSQGDAFYGASMLFVLALGMGIPLLLVGLFGAKVLPKSGEWLNDIKVAMGFGLLAVAIWLIERWYIGSEILYLWGVFFIFLGTYFFVRHQTGLQTNRSTTPIRLGLAIALLVFGIMQMIGAASGSNNMLKPLANISAGAIVKTDKNLTFATAYSLADLDKIIQDNVAKQENAKPILFDLYADWCISCKIMEQEIFLADDVYPLLEQFILVKADVTKNSLENQALMNQYQLYGPPSLLFFNTAGEGLKELTLIGEPSKEEVQERLRYVLQL